MDAAGPFAANQESTRGELTYRILDEIKSIHTKRPLDLVLTYFYNSHFDPAGFDEIHRLGVPTINFYCNSMYQFELVAAIAAKVQFSWHAEKDAREKYLKVGANPVWVQMGADPYIYRPVPAIRESKAVFVGQKYADRDRFAASLVRAGVPVHLYGTGWGTTTNDRSNMEEIPRGSFNSYVEAINGNIHRHGLVGGLARTWRQYCYRRESRALRSVYSPSARGFATTVAETFGRYEVVLNFSNVWADGRPGSDLIPHVRLRDFEAPMCKTCFLTGHTDEIGEFYKIGEEIDTYASPEELVDKTRFYLARPDSAEKLREAGYQRALRDHTWDRRFEELFRKTGLTS